MASSDFVKRLQGHALVTAEILYRLPDHRHILQSYVWQELDEAPRFPALNAFLAFWARELEGPIHSVRVAHARLISPAELRLVDREYALH